MGQASVEPVGGAEAVSAERVGLRRPTLPWSDGWLLERYRGGDGGAFEHLYRRHHRRVFAVCLGVLGSYHDAQEASQETFVKALRALRNVAPDDLGAWLSAVARNAATDFARQRSRRNERSAGAWSDGRGEGEEALASRPDAAVGSDPAALVERDEAVRALLEELGRLPEAQRRALVLRELGGLGYEAIAKTLNVSPAAARGLISRARVSLAAVEDARDLGCARVREHLAAEADGRRRPGEVRRHLRSCAECRAFRKALRDRRAALKSILPLPVHALVTRLFKEGIARGLDHLRVGEGGGSGAGALAGSKLVAAGGVKLAKGLAIGALGAATAAGGAQLSGIADWPSVISGGRDSAEAPRRGTTTGIGGGGAAALYQSVNSLSALAEGTPLSAVVARLELERFGAPVELRVALDLLARQAARALPAPLEPPLLDWMQARSYSAPSYPDAPRRGAGETQAPPSPPPPDAQRRGAGGGTPPEGGAPPSGRESGGQRSSPSPPRLPVPAGLPSVGPDIGSVRPGEALPEGAGEALPEGLPSLPQMPEPDLGLRLRR